MQAIKPGVTAKVSQAQSPDLMKMKRANIVKGMLASPLSMKDDPDRQAVSHEKTRKKSSVKAIELDLVIAKVDE